ncbi:MAG: D-glycero-beta-D-manno-heptose-7-phosphate kinase [Alphaproteobacteria bacterium]
MQDKPVLVVGDIMLDRFVYGTVERISPESPVPVLSIMREDKMLGGAGNALASLAGLKTKAHIVSLTGDDAEARMIAEEVKALGIDPSGLIRDPARPTIVKTRYLAGHQQLLRSDFEKKEPVSAALEAQIIEKINAVLPDMAAVLVSDYGKGLLSRNILRHIIDQARSHSIPVIVDPKGQDYTIYAGAYAVTPNRKELAEASGGMPTKTDQDIDAAAKKIAQECDLAYIVATRSADGMSVVKNDAGYDPVHFRTTAREVFDVSGAGDVVIATLSAALAAGADIVPAAALANLAGGIAVSKVGTAPIRFKELEAALGDLAAKVSVTPVSALQNLSRHYQAPLCDADEALEQIRRWRARGFKIGFTNGCFDILHHGHVSYLNEARSLCDRLIVALNNDLSVSALKGEGRPVHNEDSRASVLGALASVDMVVLFGGKTATEDQTACALIDKLQPDIYFKGGDYKIEQIPEAPHVQAYGGAVRTLSVFEGHSTTGSIKKINSEAA